MKARVDKAFQKLIEDFVAIGKKWIDSWDEGEERKIESGINFQLKQNNIF